jgi:hypothetical protein
LVVCDGTSCIDVGALGADHGLTENAIVPTSIADG